ncbi:MAG: protein kinase [Pseudomonadota bacterium]
MQGKEVIDLRQYQAASNIGSDDPDGLADCALQTGTPLLHGQYTVTGFLAAGGFGMTYVAKDSLSRNVVIKECFPTELCVRAGLTVTARNADYSGAYQTLLEQFVAEAHCLAKLEHRNIVHVHQVFKENGTAYMAMDYVDGVDLCQIIDARAKQSLPPREIVRITHRILEAVRYVHASGMLHLDISPDNILIDRTGEPVLIDFGAARAGGASMDAASWPLSCVKDGYSPPEFYVADRARGAWSDLYSLGASVYHLASGEAPPSGEERGAYLADEGIDPYQPLALPGYSAAFLKGIDRALQFDPMRRMQSADDWIKLIAEPIEEPRKTARKKSKPKALKPAPEVIEEEQDVRRAFVPPEPEPSKATRPVAYGVIAAAVVLGLGLSGSIIAFLPDKSEEAVQVVPQPQTTPNVTADVETVETAPQAVASNIAIEAGLLLTLDALDAETASLRSEIYVPDVMQLQPDVPEETIQVSALSTAGVTLPALQGPLGTVDIDEAPVHSVEALPVTAPLPIEVAELGAAPGEVVRDITLAGISRPGLPEQPQTAAFLAARPDAAPRAAQPVVAIATPAASPIAFAHWDIEMPFEARIEQVRNAVTAVVTEVPETTDLAISGAWIREETVIYTLNDQPLVPDTALSTLLLNNLQMDPDGFTRASVQYLDPAVGTIDRGLLAARVVRRVGLVDGTELDLGMRELEWQAQVRTVGAWSNNTLQEGDVILRATAIGSQISTLEDLELALERTQARGVTSVELEVLRAGQIVSARLPLVQGDES